MLISEGVLWNLAHVWIKLDRNIFRITNIVTTSENGFDSVNNFKVMDSGVSLVAWKTQNWGFFETKTLIYLWAEDIQC